MTQLTDEQNFGLANEVYENDNLIINETIKLSDKSKWVVINSVNETLKRIQSKTTHLLDIV